jgi:hypothetical protein
MRLLKSSRRKALAGKISNFQLRHRILRTLLGEGKSQQAKVDAAIIKNSRECVIGHNVKAHIIHITSLFKATSRDDINRLISQELEGLHRTSGAQQKKGRRRNLSF